MDKIDPNIIAAIIAACTSLSTFIVSLFFKSFWEKHFFSFKVEKEYKYEQRKALKNILSKNKIQLLNTVENLSYRLWNFSTNYKDEWHHVSGDFTENRYYFNSFVYRFIVVFSWIQKIEKEMVYLDSTVATKSDMEFVKFLRLIPQIMCDLILVKNIEYDHTYQTDHFFKNRLEQLADSLIDTTGIVTYTQYEWSYKRYNSVLSDVCMFIDGLSPEEKRLRWDRIQILHVTLMAFLNTFGYDYQKTHKSKFKEIINKPRKSRLIENYQELLAKYHLSKQKELSWMLPVLFENESFSGNLRCRLMNMFRNLENVKYS